MGGLSLKREIEAARADARALQARQRGYAKRLSIAVFAVLIVCGFAIGFLLAVNV